MSQPKTLFQLAGVTPAPHALADSALLLIDMQREYRDGVLALPDVGPAAAQAAELLAKARAAGRPVIHVQHRGAGGSGGPFDVETDRFKILETLTPEAGEGLVEKSLPNSFAGTDLAERIAALGGKSLIVGGFMTHMCVSSTVRAALDLGVPCTVVAGACATRDLPDGAGGKVAADSLHRMEIAALSDRFAMIAERAAAIV
ncbi:MAG: cysteine hydrolase family protein [Rhodospirillales bacterium]